MLHSEDGGWSNLGVCRGHLAWLSDLKFIHCLELGKMRNLIFTNCLLWYQVYQVKKKENEVTDLHLPIVCCDIKFICSGLCMEWKQDQTSDLLINRLLDIKFIYRLYRVKRQVTQGMRNSSQNIEYQPSSHHERSF